MAWLESHQELGDHPKTLRAASLLGASVPTVIGHLHLLWWWALTYAPSGDITGFTATEIAQAARWRKGPESFVDALVICGRPGGWGFLERHEGGPTVIHDWDQYTGRLISMRAANAQRARMSRERHAQRAVTSRDYQTEPNRTVPNSTDPPPVSPAAQKRTSPRKGLSPEQRAAVEAEYADIPAVGEVIDFALSHSAALKCSDENLYVRNWLRKERSNGTPQRPAAKGARSAPDLDAWQRYADRAE